MTVAICIKCGTFKDGAFMTCNDTDFILSMTNDMAYSLVLTECQTNVPFALTTITSCPLNWATILGDQ
jgi:hypothetical protein